ncbi:MAG: mechanosensitive ion channel family protein [bacterium]
MLKLPTIESFYPLLHHAIRIALILLVAFVATRIARSWLPRLRSHLINVMMRHQMETDPELEKRSHTIGHIVRKTLVVIIWSIAVLMSLKEAGFDVAPILAGAGVVGLAVGFGAQNLVRDVISGLFMLLENQIRVNDVAIINGTGGLVEEINLRTTVLRSLDGTVHIFPNGTITSLSNMTHKFSYYVFDIRVAYQEDTDRVVQVLREIADEMMRDPKYGPYILEPLDVLGVDNFADSAVIVKVRIKTAPVQQWMVGREMNRRIKKRFDELGIEIPFPHRTLYFGDASKPFPLEPSQASREQIKAIVREVLAEVRAEASSAAEGK